MANGEYQFHADQDRVAVDWLAVEYDMPMELANKFVGRTEKETQRNIEMFKDYLAELLRKRREWLNDD